MQDIMAAKNVPAKSVPALAPPIRFDDHILPYRLGAFTATATIPAIYIQQFWNTIKYYEKNVIFSCQLDKQWFDLNEEVFRDALGITPHDHNHPFVALISSNALIEFVIELGVSWARLPGFIGLDTRNRKKQPIKDKKKEPKTLLNPYSKFTKLIIYYLKSKHNFHPRTGSPLHIPDKDNVLGNLKFVAKGVKYEVFGMSIPDALITKNIRNALYYSEYLEMVAKHERRVAAKQTGQSKPAVPEPSAPKAAKLVKKTPDKPSPAKRLKGGLVGKRHKPKSPLKLVDEFADEGVPISEPRIDNEEADYQRVVELSLKDPEVRNQGPARIVVIQEPDSKRIQSLPKVQGKGNKKIIDEQVAYTLLDLNTSKKKSATNQYILQRRTPEIVEVRRSSSQPKDEGITMTNSETESNELVTPVNKEIDASYMELTKINTGVQDEGQARSNPGKQDVGQDGSNPSNAVEF
uniref:Histone deacetylase 14 n=1 Tax=Tanacetum cinerariifolium TaxID=118510 RepID=A0A699GQZ5_TANCI|nr:hypothetical protein [Tanacetum cinerariifolium]